MFSKLKNVRKGLFLSTLFLILLTAGFYASAAASNTSIVPWKPDVHYTIGDRVLYKQTTYKCRQSHTSIISWEPSKTLALWLPLSQKTSSTVSTTTPSEQNKNELYILSGYKSIYLEDYETHPLSYFYTSNFYLFYWDRQSDSNHTMAAQRYQILQENSNKYMKLTKKQGDADAFRSGLNPRTELRPEADQWRIKLNQENFITFKTRVYNANFSAEFVQIMGRDSKAFPRIQLEVKDGVYNARYHDGTNLIRQRISKNFTASNDFNKWVTWQIYFKLSNNSSQGYYKIYKDGLLVWSFNGITYPSTSNLAWMQYGCYVNNGGSNEMVIDMDDIVIAEK